MMFVVLAYANDTGARTLVQHWRASGADAALLTCADLSRIGWRHVVGTSGGSSVIDGRSIPTNEICAVVTRMPAVGEAELAHVHEDDRRYAAAEMQAFLLAWLMSLKCPVLNHPTSSNLGGPAWSTAEWVLRAARLGLAARPVRRRFTYEPGTSFGVDHRVDTDAIFVDVVGDRAFLMGGRAPRGGEVSFARAAMTLARHAGVELLRVYFKKGSEPAPVFLEAGLWIDTAAEPVAAALIERCGVVVHESSKWRAPRTRARASVGA